MAKHASFVRDWFSDRQKETKGCLQSAARDLWHRRLCDAGVVCRSRSPPTDTDVHRHPEMPAATAETRLALSQSLLKNHGGGLSTCSSSTCPEYTLFPITSNTYPGDEVSFRKPNVLRSSLNKDWKMPLQILTEAV